MMCLMIILNKLNRNIKLILFLLFIFAETGNVNFGTATLRMPTSYPDLIRILWSILFVFNLCFVAQADVL